MNKRTKYVIHEVSIQYLGTVRKRCIMSGKFVLSVSRESLAAEICHAFNKSAKPALGELSCYYEFSTVPASVPVKTVHSLAEFADQLSVN